MSCPSRKFSPRQRAYRPGADAIRGQRASLFVVTIVKRSDRSQTGNADMGLEIGFLRKIRILKCK
jgi:hypothetical protein